MPSATGCRTRSEEHTSELQDLTGLDFYPALPDDVEEEAESRYDFSVWGIRKR